MYMRIFFLLCAGLLKAGAVQAHGIEGWIEEHTALRISARHDDGEPIRHAKTIIVFADSNTPFQTGNTDHNGTFAFTPDNKGKYRVTVDDGMGHQLVLSTVYDGIEKPDHPPNKPLAIEKSNRPAGIAGGLGIILGTGGIVYAWQKRKRS